MSQVTSSCTYDAYAVGIICARPLEKAAVTAMLDEIHSRLPNVAGDDNKYTLGRIANHNIVVACLPAGVMGTNSAATVATNMMRSFPIKIGLMVGIGGGAPSKSADIRLGDVVVSQPTGQHGGVVQWDFGKMERGGRFRRTGTLNKPPRVLLTALAGLQALHELEYSQIPQHLAEMLAKYPKMRSSYGRPKRESDRLFRADYDHADGESCANCDSGKLVHRKPRDEQAAVEVHYGNIAYGNGAMGDSIARDRIASEEQILCFDAETAGLMDTFPCLVIRGICDYADSHKNKKFQRYAAATAAAYAKELLCRIDVFAVDELKPIDARQYRVPFSLERVPVVSSHKLIGRTEELGRIFNHLRPDRADGTGRNVFVICGMDSIGNTQLAVTFARQYHEKFTAVFWLDGASKERIEQSFVNIAAQVPTHQMRINVNDSAASQTADTDVIIREVLGWLSMPSNKDWLLIVDNVDQQNQAIGENDQAYNVMQMLPQVDHGSVLITSWVASVQSFGKALSLTEFEEAEACKPMEQEEGTALRGNRFMPKEVTAGSEAN